MIRRLILSASLAGCCAFAFAQTHDQLGREAAKAYADKDWARAAVLFERAFDKELADGSVYYNAACAHALAGDKDAALRALKLALANGYANGAGTEKDSDFASLHGDPRWPLLLAEIKAAEAREARLFNSPAIATPYAPDISEDEKIAGLSKFWSEVKYNFVYVETLKEIDWDKLYVEYIPKVRATSSTAEYYRVLMELCARLKDGHTNVYPSWQVWDTQLARPMIKTHLVGGKVLVREVLDPKLRAQGVLPGVEVVAVDGEPAAAYAQRDIVPYTSASTSQDLDVRAYGHFFLAGPIAKAPKVSFRDRHGKSFDVAIARYDHATLDTVNVVKPPFEFRMLPGGVAYVALNTFASQKAADGYIAAFPEIAKSNALVIDLRNNGGGNSDVGYRVLATLTSQPFRSGKWDTRNYLPTYRAWKRPMPNFGRPGSSWPADPERQYSKPVMVLTSGATYSAAEDFAVAFDTLKRGTIVGEATGGSTGQPLVISLPGGGSARICTKRDTYPDGRLFVGVGIQPGLKVAPTVADARSGRDTVLEAALAALRK
jgi:carboxyl-terminal processing protease